jgi:hypothetical protein
MQVSNHTQNRKKQKKRKKRIWPMQVHKEKKRKMNNMAHAGTQRKKGIWPMQVSKNMAYTGTQRRKKEYGP